MPKYRYDPLDNVRFAVVDGKNYLITSLDIYCLGSAGSFSVACPNCGDEHYREASDYFRNPEWYECFNLDCKKEKLLPVCLKDIESFWKPLWGASVNA